MCGRYTLLDLSDFIAMFPWVAPPQLFAPRYNVAPSQPVLMLTQNGKLEHALWGLMPPWANKAEPPKPLINARCETVVTRPAFRVAFRRKRCVVPASGFYEWDRHAGGRRPHYITREDGRPLLMAGLYEDSHDTSGGEFRTVCVITTPANEEVSKLHDRMPAILDRQDATTWLQTPETEAESLVSLLRPYPGELRLTPVDQKVNSPAYDARDCIEPMTADEDRGLFGPM